MRSVEPSSGGSPEGPVKDNQTQLSLSLPFGREIPLSSISGPTYATAQALIQQVSYALSDKLFTYSPETFDLDVAVKQWFAQQELNANGYPTTVQAMETRQGAGAIALGYIFSKDFDLKKRHIPQSVLASSATLQYLRPALEQLSLLYSVSNPLVAHIAAVDYTGGPNGGLVSDYTAALSLAEELGLGLVASHSAHESQHMALFSTLLASQIPTIHIYDGVRVGRETTRVVDALDQAGLSRVFKTVLGGLSGPASKHLDSEGKLLSLLSSFNDQLGTDYKPFEYHGHPEPTSVLVSFGTIEASLTSQIADNLAESGIQVGVINVRVYRPFVEEEFLKALPKSTKTVGVLGQVQNDLSAQEDGVHSALYEDVLASLTFSSGFRETECVEIKYSPSHSWSLVNVAAAFQRIVEQPLLKAAADAESSNPLLLLDSKVQQYTFWDVDDSTSHAASLVLGQALAKDSVYNVSTSVVHDNLVQGGVLRTDIRKSPRTLDAPYSIDSADAVYVGNVKLLGEVDVLASVKTGGRVIVNAPGIKDEDLEKKLPASFREGLTQKAVRLLILDTSTQDPSLESTILQAAFLRVAFPDLEPVALKKLALVLGNSDKLEEIYTTLATLLREIEVPESWKAVEEASESEKLAVDIRPTSFTSFDKTEAEESVQLADWQLAAQSFAFKEAYGTKQSLRPDLATKSYNITVKENRRLTPKTYDRNIFHIEFDLGDSGLKYDIGEALGIHGQNDPEHVSEFIQWYGLNADDIVQVSAREDSEALESRTVHQALQHNIDIFGKPPKRFYESLAEYAADETEAKTLLKLGSAEGATEFKDRSEVQTLTYADLLEEFPSARPSFHDLARIVSPMKRREYSIASCQAVTPTIVALMIVVVDWVDPRGRKRFGQASHYLSNLKPGTTVTASVKPSVMKLPAKSTQPLIMAGLGTGLAPFRAFCQHRALEKAQGKEIGSVLLYMGSRHQREEYCYGEEWEAYQEAGVVTLLGAAFSRDQPHKIYIQDRMRETIEDIRQAYTREEGAFYLCGPTWPVPDVTAVLEEAIGLEAKATGRKVEPSKEIEKLKEELRYVLEVY